MSPRRHSADYAAGATTWASAFATSAGLGIGLGRLLSIEAGTGTEEDKTFYRMWLSRIEGWSAGERHLQIEHASAGHRFR